MLAQLIDLCEVWSDQFPVLQNLPEFLTNVDQIPDRPRSDLPSGLEKLPHDMSSLVRFHQEWTAYLMEAHETKLDTGDFQTTSAMATFLVDYLVHTGRISSTSGEPYIVADPTCGTGTLLLAYLQHLADTAIGDQSSPTGHSTGTLPVVLLGIERNLDSLLLCWITLTIASELISEHSSISIELQLYHGDLLDVLGQTDVSDMAVDLVLSNPPWISWSNLTLSDRNRWKQFDEESGFDFIQSTGMATAMGGTNTDIGIPLVLVALYELAADDAVFAILFKPSLLNSPSLYYLREGHIPHQMPRYLELEEYVSFSTGPHFHGRQSLATDIYIGSMQKTEPSVSAITRSLVDSEYRISSQTSLDLHLLDNDVLYLSTSSDLPLSSAPSPEIRHGLKHDCRDVFEISEERAEQLNWERVYPTIKSRHMQQDGWTGDYDLVIVPHQSLRTIDEQEFRQSCPLTYKYLLDHKERLLERKSRWVQNDAFYAIFGIGEYSFATYKVAWVRLGWKPYFDVIPPVQLPNGETKPVILSDHYMFVPTENLEYATYLRDLLRSAPMQEALELLSTKKKSSLPKKLVSRLALPREQDI